MLDSLFSAIAPHYCYSCGEIGKELCLYCKYDIALSYHEQCILCEGILVNYRCRGSCKLRTVDQIILCKREGAIEALLDSLKYKYRRETAGVLVDVLSPHVPDLPKDAILVPIATAPSHIRRRGFDHMSTLSRSFSRRHDIKVIPLLGRHRSTRQVGKSRTERWQQTKGLFYARRQLSSDATYVLFDDVVTTGATMLRAADVLRAAGAKKVIILALMHQPWKS